MNIIKKCRKCKETQDIKNFPPMNIWKYWVWSTCNNCLVANNTDYTIKRTPLKTSQKAINKVSKTNNNTPAKFTTETKEEICKRDGSMCIICECFQNFEFEYHHVFYWANANRWPNRNNSDQGVTLCHWCHHEIHHWTEWKGKLYRARCIEYLLKL